MSKPNSPGSCLFCGGYVPFVIGPRARTSGAPDPDAGCIWRCLGSSDGSDGGALLRRQTMEHAASLGLPADPSQSHSDGRDHYFCGGGDGTWHVTCRQCTPRYVLEAT